MADATFYNVWRTKTPKDRAALIAKMKGEAPALAAKPGFVSMSVLECAEDGRVLVEARWQSKEAFDRAVTDDPAAHRSRASLAELGSPEPGLFKEAFRISPAHAGAMVGDGCRAVISAASGIVTYVQVWRMSATGNQQRWLETMHSRIGLLTRQPGFLSMSLHASLDGKQTAVYAQWQNETSLTAAVNLPEAKRSHDEMARWGTPDGSLYGVDSVFLPYASEQAERMTSPQKNTANSPADIKEHRAEVNGQAIHYLKAGAGPALLLVHGYPESSESWRKVAPELAKSFTVIAPDTRGVGQSSVADNFSLEDVADDMYELVKSLGFKDVRLVGQDFGVQVVSAYAAKHREEVSALVAIESPLSAFGLEDLFGSFWHFGFLASPLAEMLIAGKEKEFFHAFAFDGFVFRKEAFFPADIDHYIANQTRSGRLKAGLTYYRALLAGKVFFANTVAPPWTFPVLAIDGDHSMNGLTANSFARIAPGLKSHIAPDCGHFVQEEQPEFLVRTLLDFLPRL
jgi:pimeloyl-ACP methyl ester carboxylesterase/heme-degrading monooxygenase HmoA